MKKIVSLLLVLSMLLAMALTLASCGAPEDDGARIKVYLGSEIRDFDPTDYYVDSNAEQVMSMLFEPLFAYRNGKIECAMAEEYEVDREERKIVVTLRESYWSNNTRVTAADFVYAWCERLLSPDNANPAAALLYDIENAAAHKNGTPGAGDPMIEATGTYELTITYREGADYKQLLRNLSSVATSPIREPKDVSSMNYWSKSVVTCYSNGPFKLTAYDDLGGGFTLTRNKGYHQDYKIEDYDDEVKPGAIVALTTAFGEAIGVSVKDVEKKVVFYLGEAPLSERSANSKKTKLVDDTSVYSYVFDTKNPLFAIPEVRLALSMAIDRAAIAASVVYGKAADGIIPDASSGSGEALISTKADITAAKALLEGAAVKAKLASLNKSFTLTVANDEESKKIAETVKTAWAELGFTVTVNTVGNVKTTVTVGGQNPTEIYDSAIQAMVKRASVDPDYSFGVIALDWQTYSNDAFVALAAFTSDINGCGRVLPDGGVRTSITRWVDADYDALVSAAYKATDKDERAEYLAAAEKKLAEAMPIMPILFNQTATYKSKDISGIKYDEFGNVIFTRAKQKNYQDYLEDEE